MGLFSSIAEVAGIVATPIAITVEDSSSLWNDDKALCHFSVDRLSLSC
jgi:hypothetical protein